MFHHRKLNTYEISIYNCSPLPAAFASAVNIPAFGEQTSNENYTFLNFIRNQSAHFIMEGEGEFTVDGVPWETKAGDVMVFFSGQEVHYRSKSALWHYFWIYLEGEHVDELLLELGYSRENPLRSNGSLARKMEVLERLKLEEGSNNFSHLHSLRTLADLLELMGDGLPGRDEELAVKVKRRLENLDGGVPQINELAEYFNVSRATLFRTFKSKYGISVKEHLDRHRLEHAADLLAHTQIPLSGIAALCGYRTERYFNQVFAKKYSQPPGAFRLGKAREKPNG